MDRNTLALIVELLRRILAIQAGTEPAPLRSMRQAFEEIERLQVELSPTPPLGPPPAEADK